MVQVPFVEKGIASQLNYPGAIVEINWPCKCEFVSKFFISLICVFIFTPYHASLVAKAVKQILKSVEGVLQLCYLFQNCFVQSTSVL